MKEEGRSPSRPGAMANEWRTIEVRVPPEDDRFPKGWWVNTRTGAAVDGALPSPGSTIIVPAGQMDGHEVTPQRELTAVWPGPDGTEQYVRIDLFSLGGALGVAVYPDENAGTVLRFDGGPAEEPAVIHWRAPGPDGGKYR